MIAEEIQAASQYMLIAFLFPILGLSLSLGIYFLFFWEDHHIQPLGHFSEKMKRKTAGAQHQAWTRDVQCSRFSPFLSFPFHLVYISCSFEVIFQGRQGHSVGPGREMYNIWRFYHLYTNSFFQLVLFWATRNQHKISFEYECKYLFGFFIDILQDFFSIPAARFYHSWVESPV